MSKQPIIIRIKTDDPWCGPDCKDTEIDNKSNSFEFEVKDEIFWARNCTIFDATMFNVYAIFRNSTKTREETVELVPEKIG